jgi:hypothetical protein
MERCELERLPGECLEENPLAALVLAIELEARLAL